MYTYTLCDRNAVRL